MTNGPKKVSVAVAHTHQIVGKREKSWLRERSELRGLPRGKRAGLYLANRTKKMVKASRSTPPPRRTPHAPPVL